MKSTFFTSLAVFLVSTSACGVDTFGPDAGDGGPVGTVSGGGQPDGGSGSDGAASSDALPPPGCDVTKLPTEDACVITEALGVFVSSSMGSPGGDGSRAHPLASIGAAIAAANKVQRRVYACAEPYAEQVQLAAGTSVFGYFTCSAGWVIGTTHAQVKAPASPAVTAANIALATRIEAVDMIAPDFTSGGQSSIGLLATGSPGLDIVQAKIHAGTGGNGGNGVDGIQLTDSGTAKNGGSTWADGVATNQLYVNLESLPPPGGTNACTGASGHDGGPGGMGGTGGKYESEFIFGGYTWSGLVTNGVGSPTTATTQTAQGGTYGIGGSSGAAGASGASGTSGGAMGTLAPSGYTPSDGTTGADGDPGQGGGGSGGVTLTSADYSAATYAGYYGWGESGAGGGAGGCPGLAGTAGKGGGASIAILAVQSPFNLDTVTVESSAGGAGGSAGGPSAPTSGGTGGSPAVHTYAGGNGGGGGYAGVSGNGGGGPSLGIAYQGTEPTLSASNVNPGPGGSGVAMRVVNSETIPASPSGLSQAAVSF